MRVPLVLPLLVACACAYDDETQEVQSLKSVKGGFGGGRFYQGASNLDRFYGNFSSDSMRTNFTGYQKIDFEVGVCYIEVPTASLARDPAHIPAGNGSRSDLSRIRTCCKGYIRNIHNFRICEPVCTNECVNALCTAPETCTCFPDHVKNLAGFCIPTCPIGCQNGHCAGGECLCKEGYKLDSDSKYCSPTCKELCGGLGNCTAPNTCECKTGYESTADGACVPHCEKCLNGQCVSPNVCQCHSGFVRDKDGCKPVCNHCTNGDCVGPDDCQCRKGYSKNTQGDCSPVCEYCVNGECVAPNECKCNGGYTKNKEGQCSPQCSPDCGVTGKCISPNVCSYPQTNQPGNQGNQYPGNQPNHNPGNQPNQYPGNYPNQYPGNLLNQYPGSQPNQTQTDLPNPFNLMPDPIQPGQIPVNPSNQITGTPQCPYPCINGKCTERNLCLCNYGYVLDRNDPTESRCIPHCPGGCKNGICSGPYFCLCNVGYYKDFSVKGREACIKREKRSIKERPVNVAELLVFELPEY